MLGIRLTNIRSLFLIMWDYISRFYNYLSKLFVPRKINRRQLKTELPPSRYCTPLRTPSLSRVNITNFKNPQLSRQNSYPGELNKPIRLPTSIPLARSSSQISLWKFGSEDIRRRPERFSRHRRFDNAFPNGKNKRMDLNFAPELFSTKANRSTPIPEFYNKDSKSFEDHMETGDNSLNFCDTYDDFLMDKAQVHSRNIQCLHDGFPQKCSKSKVPVNNHGRCVIPQRLDEIKFPHRQRGRHTLTSRKAISKESQETGDTMDSACKPLDLGNWMSYRTDTSAKFESIFRSIAKKHANRYLMDSTSHIQWMQLAGINADKEANMFKQFAGNQVVLSLGEYKFLIDKICSIHDLDYWDTLRKMATFRDYNLHHKSLLTSQ